MSGVHCSAPVLLVLNIGSSSIKWSVHNTAIPAGAGSVETITAGQSTTQVGINAVTLLASMRASYAVCAVVVRVVHGGAEFFKPLVINDNNVQKLQRLISLAPLHNQVVIEHILQLRHAHSSVPVIAVFDTEFFVSLPKVAQTYALPAALIDKHRLRRYGFHGFAHKSMVSQWQSLNPDVDNYTLVTAQLGSGCSMAAIRDGKPIDTTMGFTPNEGLLMRTRSGDIDPGLLTWLQRQEGWSPEDTDRVLNHESGWRGLSGGTDNMADLYASGNTQSRLAFDLFCYQFQKILGSYFAILGGLHGIVLSGGIAENNTAIGRRLLSGLSHVGIELAETPKCSDFPLCLSQSYSPVQCWVVAADEAASMVSSVQQYFSFDDGVQPLADEESLCMR